MAKNDYIDGGHENDCHNDVNVITQIKGRLLSVITE